MSKKNPDAEGFSLKGGRAVVRDTQSGREFEKPELEVKNHSKHLDHRQGESITGGDQGGREFIEPKIPDLNFNRTRQRKSRAVERAQPLPEPTPNFVNPGQFDRGKGGVPDIHDVQDGRRFTAPEVPDLEHNPHLRDRQDGIIRISGNEEDRGRFYVAPPEIGLDFAKHLNKPTHPARATAPEEVHPSRDVFAVPEGGRNSFRKSGSSSYQAPSDAVETFASGQVDDPQNAGTNDFRQVAEAARDYAPWLNQRKQTTPEPAPEKPQPSSSGSRSFDVMGGLNQTKVYGPSSDYAPPKTEVKNFNRGLDGRFAPKGDHPGENRDLLKAEYDRVRSRAGEQNYSNWLDRE